MYSLTFFNRDFSLRVQPVVKFSVDRLVWSAEGGPSEAHLSAKTDNQSALGLANLLRCPVEVMNQQGRVVWWGYLESVEFAGIRFDISSMANAVEAEYTFTTDEGSSIVSQKYYTPWAYDLFSQVDFGVKRKILQAGEVSYERALNLRDQAILAHGSPQPGRAAGVIKEAEPASGSPKGDTDGILPVQLVCHGWFETLDWAYYSNLAGFESYTISGVGVQSVADVAGETKLAQSMQTVLSGWDLDSIWLKACKAGAPGDNLVVSVYADVAGSPGGSVLASGTFAGSSLSVDYAWVKVFFSATLTIGTGIYWFVLSRSGALDAVNFYKVKVNEACGYSRGAAKLWNGAAWVARSPDADLNFTILGRLDTSWQITLIADPGQCGQFLTGVVVHTSSGLYITPYRDGSKTGLQEVRRILASGTGAGDGLIVFVNQSRVLHISGKSLASQLIQGEDGVIRDPYNQPALEETIAGQWLRIERPGLELSTMQFITQAEADSEGNISLEW